MAHALSTLNSDFARGPTRGLTVPNRPNVVSFRIPAVPSVSSSTQSPSSLCPLVSSRVLLVPELRDTAVTSRMVENQR
jgi:hypothetical protein